MLRIYDVALEMVREVAPLADRVGAKDRDLARQLRRASTSVVLNIAEGSGCRGGNRRLRYESALGSALETRAGLEAAQAIGYLGRVDAGLLGRFDQLAGTLTKLVT